jgi:hypothetical protein
LQSDVEQNLRSGQDEHARNMSENRSVGNLHLTKKLTFFELRLGGKLASAKKSFSLEKA